MTTKIDIALGLAVRAHRGQKYGKAPYVKHLADVVNNIVLYGAATETLEAAAWLHDTVEDTDLPLDSIRKACGDEIAELVFAVTNEKGENRRERNRRTYPKIQAVPGAVTLKLADRIANVESCWETRDSKLFMYQREYKEFRKALRVDPQNNSASAMWDRLDQLLGWWEPS